MKESQVRVYIACSLDGFIAGVDDDLSWLPSGGDETAVADPNIITYDAFSAEIGAMLMGRSTYDVVAGFDIDWPYGEKPVLVATNRPLTPAADMVRAVSGSIEEIIEEAKTAAQGKDVYLDGGILIRQGLDAGLVDELVVTLVPVVLGEGVPLFAGVTQRHRFEILEYGRYGDMLQLQMRVKQP